MSEKTNTKHADSEQREGQDGKSSPSRVLASGTDRDEHVSSGGEITTVTAELSSSVAAEPEQRSSQHVGSGGSEVSLDSLARKTGASSSSRIQSEATAAASEPSAPLLEHKSEACQTPEPANVAYRSLILQFSPVRRDQEHRISKPVFTLPPVLTEHDWLDGMHSPLSPKSPEMPLPGPENLSMLWNSVTPPDVDTTSTSTIQIVPSVGYDVSAAALSRRQQRGADDKAPQEPEAPGSPRLLAPWSETLRGLDRKRGTPEVFRDTSSSTSCSVSASELSSPAIGTALHSPRLRLVGSDTTPRIPWVTLAVIWLQLQSHWNHLHKDYPDRCASVSTIVLENRWERVLFAAFHHGDVKILALNSLCFFTNGVLLEAGLGAAHFAALFATAAILVGLVNTFILRFLYEYTKLSSWQTVCSQTFVGIIMTLEALTSTKFGKARVHYGKRRFRVWRTLFAVLETVLLLWWTESNVCPIVSGILVGAFLAYTSPGNFITRIRRPRRSLYICVIPYAPVTYLLVTAVIVAFLQGPFPDPLTLAETGLSFRVPVWRPMLLPMLYQPDVYWLAYAVLSIWDVGQELEQEIGHLGFLFLAGLLLKALHVLLDGLCWILWYHLLALGDNLPTPVPHSSSCTCGLVAVLMALKVIHHVMHPGCVYRMASVPIYVPFWTGVLFELGVQNIASGSAAYIYGPVLGILLGIAVTCVRVDCLSKLTARLAGLSDIGILLRGTDVTPENVLLMLRH